MEKDDVLRAAWVFCRRPIDPTGERLLAIQKDLMEHNVTLGEFIYWVSQQDFNQTRELNQINFRIDW